MEKPLKKPLNEPRARIIFSIISIVIGGGFFIRLILGIIGGVLGFAKK